ncbi:MAG TPA: rhodanese-like domain-containing protein [Gemmatimonadaceae bacterium]|nr:rhodanese-like domain-containing protein [Gemmatimonadaceae bacterium]
MFFRRFYEEGLAQASYLIGCERSGEAIVVDANRAVSQYTEGAAAAGLRITRVAETHIHADFVSGSRELASLSGATLLLSAEGGPEWQYEFAQRDGAVLLHDGDIVPIGNVRLAVLHTPGHSPEHLSYLVTDLAASDRPLGLISGDFVFVGDVGRPDLLETAVKITGTMETAARTLFGSLARFRALPDFVQVWPGHGAGSACGKALGAMAQSTVGYERIANWGVAARDEALFVRQVLDGQPDTPPYFAVMKRMNREGPPLLRELPIPKRQDPANIIRLANASDVVLDVRPADAFAESHIPGSLNLPVGTPLASWAGWVVPYDREIFLVADDAGAADRALHEMTLIGLDRVAGWFASDALASWERNGRQLQRVARLSVSELAARMTRSEVTVIDVRNDMEWGQEHLAAAVHLPLGQLSRRLDEVPRSRPVVVYCQSGTRSAIAASILLASGLGDVSNLRGGFAEWTREGKPALRD